MKTSALKIKRGMTPRANTRTSRRTPAAVIELVPALIRIKSILVPVDFSKTSEKAIRYAVRMAEQFGSKITLLHVVQPITTPDFAYHPLMLETDKAKESAKARLGTLCRKLIVPSRLVEKTLVRYGAPFAEIAAAAKTLKADLIVLTTHGYTGLKHVLMGSTAERVVRHAPCPVLTVREKEHEFA